MYKECGVNSFNYHVLFSRAFNTHKKNGLQLILNRRLIIMKRISISILVALVAFIATAAITRSWGQSQLEPYLGVNGWTLKRNIILTPTARNLK